MTSRQSTKAFLQTIKNRLLRSNSKLQYLPAEKIIPNSSYALGNSTRLLDEIEISSRTVINGSRISLQNQPQKELHSIILHLERESEKIIPQIEKLCARNGVNENDYQSELRKCLLNHKDQVRVNYFIFVWRENSVEFGARRNFNKIHHKWTFYLA